MHNLLPSPQTNDSTTRLDTLLRSLNTSEGFKTSLDSAYYIKTEVVPGQIPAVSDAALFPTDSGFDLTFGLWWPYNGTIYGQRDPPTEDKKWQYDVAAQRWTDAEITRRNWFQAESSRRISSSMTAWIPSLRQGFLFGGAFSSVNEASLNVTNLEEHGGLITYDQATNTWTNETTPLGGISDGGLVHITTAKDEVLIQLGGRSGSSTYVVCISTDLISPHEMLIDSIRENFPRSTSIAQADQSGIPNLYHPKLWCQLLDSHSALLSNQPRMVLAIKSTLWEASKLVLRKMLGEAQQLIPSGFFRFQVLSGPNCQFCQRLQPRTRTGGLRQDVEQLENTTFSTMAG